MTPSDQLRILVTRPAIQAEQLCDALRSAGAIPVLLPLINIVPHLESKKSEVWNAIAAYDWIVFSSANGVVYCWSQLTTQQQQALRKHPQIAVVGPATAEAATDLGMTVCRIAPEHIAESLVNTLGTVTNQRVLWPRSAQARTVITDQLRERGATVDDIIVYHVSAASIPENAAQIVRDAHILTFASPSAVHHFVQHFGTNHTHPIVCIGPVTAAAARSNGLSVSAVAESYTTDGMVDALTLFANSHFATERAGRSVTFAVPS